MSDWIDAIEAIAIGDDFDVSSLSELDAECLKGAMAAEIAEKVIRLASGNDSDVSKKLRAGQMEIFGLAINILGRVSEAKTCAIFDYLINKDGSYLLNELNCEVESVRREVKFPCGFADRVISHADDSMTVVEIKAAGSRRDHMQGLGQALMYASAARELGMSQEVRAALFVSGDKDKWVEAACNSVGVLYITVPLAIERQIERYAQYAKRVTYGRA